jgi:hypothetical protein
LPTILAPMVSQVLKELSVRLVLEALALRVL